MKQNQWLLPLISMMLLIFMLASCTKQDPTYEPTNNPGLELTKLSDKGITDQQPADEAKQLLSQYEEVSGVRAVNHNGQLLVAIDINHGDRFSLKHLEKKFRGKIEQNFPEMKVTVSTDQKLLFELKELENEIANESISKKEINDRMKKLRKLMKEKT